MGLINFCNKTITYSFYALFFLVPLIFSSSTSELFELNKMWLTWGLTLIIGVSWFTKMIVEKELRIQRTPLDIPLVLFLVSQIIATIFSLDQRISWWGYYSRFNGGLLSTITYIFLYYAFVTNLRKKEAYRTLTISLVSGLVVALWGLPSHFGYDPTCLLFRGTFDVSCWTEAFKPTVRIFSTLGQPAWLSAFLAILLPITMAFFLQSIPQDEISSLKKLFTKPLTIGYFLLTILFYLDLTFTNTRAGFLGFWIANLFFWGVLYVTNSIHKKKLVYSFSLFTVIFILINFLFGTTFPQLDKYTVPGIVESRQRQVTQTETKDTPPSNAPTPAGDLGGTDSGAIRLLVWQGAIDAWKANPIFGTGVETFAFAYYQHRPAAHNLTSEWDYLYNKAHNEYLNYLTTTGAFGLLSYLLIIAVLLFIAAKTILSHMKNTSKTTQLEDWVLTVSLIAAFGSILVTNFFGFSVVIINLFLFLIPAFYFLLRDSLNADKTLSFGKTTKQTLTTPSPYQWTFISIVWFVGFFLLYLLLRFWQADTAYALGSNLQRAGDVQGAYTQLSKAVSIRPAEPVIQDEYAINLSTLGTALISNNEATVGAQLAQQAVTISDAIVALHPNNITFWKSRVRIFYALSQIDPKYLGKALEAIQKASILAPTDAKVMYNLGVLYGQNNEPEKAVEVLTKTIKLKPDYRDAYYARALFYRQMAIQDDGSVINQEMQEKANADLRYILQTLKPQDEQAAKTLKSWGGR